MKGKYDPEHISTFFDEYGEREWERLGADASGRVSFQLHRRYLERYVSSADRVLEVGAGAGRFTIELARLGAQVTVGDVSPGQLELNRKKVAEAGRENRVVSRELMDVTDLSRFPERSFDAVVCYGGPLSYVFDRADDALREMLRVTKSGGHVLLSVMSLAGGARKFLEAVLNLSREVGIETVQRFVETGDHTGAVSEGHDCHMYRWEELKALLERHPCEIVAASAANFLSVQNEDELEGIEEEPELWEALLGWEQRFCEQPGALDAGTHIITIVRRIRPGRGGFTKVLRSPWIARGTHQGKLLGICPTGKQVEFRGMRIQRLSGGKLVKTWHQPDTLGMMGRLGLSPESRQPPES